jgi:opacity protein-like surface antigen
LAMCKTSLVIGLAVCLIAGTALAGGTPETGPGTKQLVFMFHGLEHLGLKSYDGGLGFRYFLAQGLALRPGVNLALYSETDKALSPGYEDREYAEVSIDGSLVLEKYLSPIHSVSPYVGVGVGFSSYGEAEKPVRTTGSQEETAKGRGAFQGMALAGFQWYFTEAMSLGGEYRGSVRFGSCKEEATNSVGAKATTEEGSFFDLSWYAASVFFSVSF